jgi:transmembrane sensor
MTQAEQIAGLIIQHLHGELTPAGQVELEAWMAESAGHRDTVESFIQEEALAQGIREHAVEGRIWERLHTLINIEKPVPIRRIGIWKYAAAAIVVGISIGGYFLLFNRPAKQMTQTAKDLQINDVPAPTGTRTTLTLASGQRILLDSVQSGTLAQQGNAQVAKLANNQLVYNVSTEKPTEVVYNTLSTAKGGQTMLTLSDGTKVWLNAASSIRYPTAFTGKERRVEITGEAYFEVFKNADQPFKVNINGKVEVEVLGTNFNINSYEDEPTIKTTLLDGSVRVAAATTHPLVGVDTNDDKISFVLKPGQQAQVVGVNTTNNDGRIKVVKDVDVDQVVAWKNGLFSFAHTDLHTLLRQLARWYDIDVRYEDKVPEEHFSGRLDRSLTLDQMLHILTNHKIHYTIEPNRQLTIRP